MPARAASRARAALDRHRWTIGVFVAVLVLLGTWVVGVPRYGAPDEVAHTIKAYATARGETIGDPIPGVSPLTRSFLAPADLASEGQACFAFQPSVTAACAAPVQDPTLVRLQSSAATYPPAYYAVLGVATRVVGKDHSLRTYRMVSVAVVAGTLAAAASILARLGRGRPTLLLVAMTPMAVFMCASVNPTSVEITGALLLWTYLAALALGPEVATTRQLVIASGIAGLVTLVRPVALPWLLVAIASYLVLERRPLAPDRRTLARVAARSAAPLGAAMVLSAAWSRYAGVGLTDDKFVSDASTIDVFRQGLGKTALLLEQAIGILGWLDTSLPFAVVALSIGGLSALVLLIALFGTRRMRWLLVAWLAIWVLYPAIYVTVARTPQVWQGRYNLPLLGALVMGGAWVARSGVAASSLDRVLRFVGAAFVAIEVLAFHQTLRRFMVGSMGDILLREPGWRPSVGAWPLICVNALAAVGLVVLLRRSPSGAVR